MKKLTTICGCGHGAHQHYKRRGRCLARQCPCRRYHVAENEFYFAHGQTLFEYTVVGVAIGLVVAAILVRYGIDLRYFFNNTVQPAIQQQVKPPTTGGPGSI